MIFLIASFGYYSGMKINRSYAINSKQTLSLYDKGVGFVFKNEKIDFDFKYVATEETLTLVFNDDASWATLKLEGERLRGKLFSYLHQPKELEWNLLECEFISKPKARNALQAVRFYDIKALESFEAGINYSEMLIEASTCGHIDMLHFCLAKGASLHVEIENFTEDVNQSCFALTKAIQYGHVEIIKELLKEKINLAPKEFDISRDNFYQACFLYQSRPDIAREIIEMLLEYGVDFSVMSAYYLTAVMVVYKEGPLGRANEDINMLKLLLQYPVAIDDFMMIQVGAEDTAFMYTAHMGLFACLKLLKDKGADVFKSFEGLNALDRVISPVLIDPSMQNQNSLKIKSYLEDLGLMASELEDKAQEHEEEKLTGTNDISAIKDLFTS